MDEDDEDLNWKINVSVFAFTSILSHFIVFHCFVLYCISLQSYTLYCIL